MVEVTKHPHSGNGSILEGIITIGLFGTAFYFIFLHGSKAYGQMNEKDSLLSNNTGDFIKPSIFGRQSFPHESGNPRMVANGFPMPDDINKLQFIDSHIRVLTKPNVTDTFGGLPSRAGVKLFRNGSRLGYQGYVQGVKDVYYEEYDDIKDKIILQENTYIKNFIIPKS